MLLLFRLKSTSKHEVYFLVLINYFMSFLCSSQLVEVSMGDLVSVL